MNMNMFSLAQRDEHLPLDKIIDAPIGMFDSGIGGLTVAVEVLKQLPNEHILYYADTQNVPYGGRQGDEIRQLTMNSVDWLYQHGCKIAIVACNTASAYGLDYVREKYQDKMAIIGLVPAVKPAVLQSKSKKIAVLATPATLKGRLFNQVVQEIAVPNQTEVFPIFCLELVPFIEEGQANSSACREVLRNTLQPVIEQGVDALVLGCTHYPFLQQTIASIYPDLTLIHSGQAIARQADRILTKQNLKQNKTDYLSVHEPRLHCVFSGNNKQCMSPIVETMFGQPHWDYHDLNEYLQYESI